MQAAIKFANACEFDHRKAFHIPHFDFFEESASASPMLFNGSASADRGRFSFYGASRYYCTMVYYTYA